MRTNLEKRRLTPAGVRLTVFVVIVVVLSLAPTAGAQTLEDKQISRPVPYSRGDLGDLGGSSRTLG